jgi:hypothetical protein
VGGASFESTIGVGNGAACVVMKMDLNITADDATERSNEVVDLSRRCTTHRICDPDTMDTDFVDG